MYIKKENPVSHYFTDHIEEMNLLGYRYDDSSYPRFQKSLHYNREDYIITMFLEELDVFWDLDGKGIVSSEEKVRPEEISRQLYITVSLHVFSTGEYKRRLSSHLEVVDVALKSEFFLPIPEMELLALEPPYFREQSVKRDLSDVEVMRLYDFK